MDSPSKSRKSTFFKLVIFNFLLYTVICKKRFYLLNKIVLQIEKYIKNGQQKFSLPLIYDRRKFWNER